MIKVPDLKIFYMANSLKNGEYILMYLNKFLEENDPSELTHTLGVIAKERMTKILRESDIGGSVALMN